MHSWWSWLEQGAVRPKVFWQAICPPACLPACLPAYPPNRLPACLTAWFRVGIGTPGCLGNGLTASQSTPVLVSGSYNFTKVYTSVMSSTSALHACGLLSNQSIVCWGTGANGRLGNGATSDSTTPVLVSSSSLFTSLSVGGMHTCGVDSTHKAWCWGESALLAARVVVNEHVCAWERCLRALRSRPHLLPSAPVSWLLIHCR